MFLENLNNKIARRLSHGQLYPFVVVRSTSFYTFLEMKLSMTDIAKRLGKHRSTLYRELERNKEPEGYLPGTAQFKAGERAKQKRPSKIEKDGYLRDYVMRSLKKGWSPEQISGRMKYHKLTIYVCPETIYQFVYRSKNKELYHCLPYKKSRRQKRYSRQKSPCRYGKIRLITERPADIAARKKLGHWEGDSIVFRGEKEKAVTTWLYPKGGGTLT